MRKLLTAAALVATVAAGPSLLARGGGHGHGGGHSKGSHSKSSHVKSTVPHVKSGGATNPSVVHVKGYVKKDGTVVAPHDRTAPNNTKNDNWSTKGNINPETGKEGTKPPDPSKPPVQ